MMKKFVFLSVCVSGDRFGWELQDHVSHGDGGVEGAQGQRHGCSGGLCLRPPAQLEAHGQ